LAKALGVTFQEGLLGGLNAKVKVKDTVTVNVHVNANDSAKGKGKARARARICMRRGRLTMGLE
jgi:hypothetical protein